jgi:hypothetical protein
VIHREEAQPKGQTLEQIVEQLEKDVKNWSADDKAHVRAGLLKRYGLVKGSGGKPS